MTARRIQLWVWLLLPFLVARALMPVGFMAQAQGGKLQIVFCTAGFSQPAQDHHDDKHAGHNDFSCPFAHVAVAPLLTVGGSEAIPFIATAAVVLPADSPYYAVGPPRFVATRGPPLLS